MRVHQFQVTGEEFAAQSGNPWMPGAARDPSSDRHPGPQWRIWRKNHLTLAKPVDVALWHKPEVGDYLRLARIGSQQDHIWKLVTFVEDLPAEMQPYSHSVSLSPIETGAEHLLPLLADNPEPFGLVDPCAYEWIVTSLPTEHAVVKYVCDCKMKTEASRRTESASELRYPEMTSRNYVVILPGDSGHASPVRLAQCLECGRINVNTSDFLAWRSSTVVDLRTRNEVSRIWSNPRGNR